jgi:sulfhydrogenase subunit alpha
MHQIDFDINLDEISKIEGEAGLEVHVRNSVVESVKFKIQEYKRFYTQGMRGQKAESIPQFVARICGTCSNAHLLGSIEAGENALGITVTPQTQILKKLMVNGLMIRDHALHLYIFALPDIFGVDSILDFDEKDPTQDQYLHDALEVKSAGNNLQVYTAGRSVHAPYAAIGGFTQVPTTPPDVTIKKLEESREGILRLIKIFGENQSVLDRHTTYMAIQGADSWSFLEGVIASSKGQRIEEKRFRDHLERVVIPYSQASGYTYKGTTYMSGALARINLNKAQLHPRTQESAAKYIALFPTTNVFYNNVAQALEMLHCLDESIDILKSTTFKPEPLVKATRQDGIGVGVIEAPRGLLFYKLEVEGGIVVDGQVTIPTGQNQMNIEKDIGQLIQLNLTMPKDKLEFEIEKLIRAYDPCMSCASHFLKVKWDEK